MPPQGLTCTMSSASIRPGQTTFLRGGQFLLAPVYGWFTEGRRVLYLAVERSSAAGHDPEWFANIKARTGSVPTIRYFDLTMIADNEAGSVTEFQCRGAIG
jgi:hypothetical protein